MNKINPARWHISQLQDTTQNEHEKRAYQKVLDYLKQTDEEEDKNFKELFKEIDQVKELRYTGSKFFDYISFVFQIWRTNDGKIVFDPYLGILYESASKRLELCFVFFIVTIHFGRTRSLFSDGICPICGELCGNGGIGGLTCDCDWSEEVTDE